MKLAIATTLAAVATGTTVADLKAQQQFLAFVKQYNKEYATEEVFKRFNIFKKNLAFVEAHDAEAEGFSVAINKFADLTVEEFKAQYFGYVPNSKGSTSNDVHKADPSVTVPASVDWVAKGGVVTPVKNQGQCGSCWAFSTTGSTEGAVALKTGKLTSLSEQQLVDCSSTEGNMGCNGGLMDKGFEYIVKNNGIGSEASYPYKAQEGDCQKVASVATITSHKDVARSEADLMSAVAQQPVSVAIEADQSAFQMYNGGIISSGCYQSLDHGVLVVGYGTDSGVDYWKVKNSWGASWGEQGYVRIARGKKPSECGITMMASYPIA